MDRSERKIKEARERACFCTYRTEQLTRQAPTSPLLTCLNQTLLTTAALSSLHKEVTGFIPDPPLPGRAVAKLCQTQRLAFLTCRSEAFDLSNSRLKTHEAALDESVAGSRTTA